MYVVDMYGRIIETRNVKANSNFKFGDIYKPGTYFVRILRGTEHKEKNRLNFLTNQNRPFIKVPRFLSGLYFNMPI